MNHESAFLLNKVEFQNSGGISTARCYGQIQNVVIADVNKYIHYGYEKADMKVSVYYDYGDIYHNERTGVLKKCPFLKNVLIPNHSAFQGISLMEEQFKKEHAKYNDDIICKTSQDPYSCLFYSIYNIRLNFLNAYEIMSEISHLFHVNNEGGEQFLFEPVEDFKWFLVYYSHIAGRSGLKKWVVELMDKFRGDTQDSSCQNPRCKKYAEDIANPDKSLSLSVFREEFKKYAEIKTKNTFIDEKERNENIEALESFLNCRNSEQLTEKQKNSRNDKKRNLLRFIRHTSTKQEYERIQNDLNKIFVCAGRELTATEQKERNKKLKLFSDFVKNAKITDKGKKERNRTLIDTSVFVNKIEEDLKYLSNSNGHLKSHLMRLHGRSHPIDDEKINDFIDYVANHCPTQLYEVL